MSSVLINHPNRILITSSSLAAALVLHGKAAFLSCCFATIAGVSLLDLWFALDNSMIMEMEKNPVCLALMRLEPKGMSLFIAGKILGTLAVVLGLGLLHRTHYRHATLVTLALTFFQVLLVVFLIFSDPLTNNLPNFNLLFVETDGSVWDLDQRNRTYSAH